MPTFCTPCLIDDSPDVLCTDIQKHWPSKGSHPNPQSKLNFVERTRGPMIYLQYLIGFLGVLCLLAALGILPGDCDVALDR